MSLLFVLVFWAHGFSWATLEYLIFVAGLVTASFIDLDHFLLPDVITLPGLALGLIGAALNPERDFLQAFWGALFGGGFLWLIGYVYLILRETEGMGGGDVKLLAWIGSILGWQNIPFVILLSALTGSVLGLSLGFIQKKDSHLGLKTVIPFGPYLAFSTLVCLLGGTEWARMYLRWFIPEI
jgi:leader peptidase (prepilin peptidase)/N-methyltransferase